MLWNRFVFPYGFFVYEQESRTSIVDEDHAFLSRNPELPGDSRFHGMFLQADGRPLLFGDPMANEETEKLYFSIL